MIHRHYTAATINLETRGEAKTPVLRGLIPYNSDSHDLGGFVERIAPGAFSSSVKRGDMLALVDHDVNRPLANQRAGSLVMTDTPDGLSLEITPTEASWGSDTVTAVREGNKAGVSFGFNYVEGGADWQRDNGRTVCTLRDINAVEVSVVTRGAYPAASVGLRSLDTAVQVETYGLDLTALEKILCAAKRGLSITTEEMNVARTAIEMLRGSIRSPALEAAAERAAKYLL